MPTSSYLIALPSQPKRIPKAKPRPIITGRNVISPIRTSSPVTALISSGLMLLFMTPNLSGAGDIYIEVSDPGIFQYSSLFHSIGSRGLRRGGIGV